MCNVLRLNIWEEHLKVEIAWKMLYLQRAKDELLTLFNISTTIMWLYTYFPGPTPWGRKLRFHTFLVFWMDGWTAPKIRSLLHLAISLQFLWSRPSFQWNIQLTQYLLFNSMQQVNSVKFKDKFTVDIRFYRCKTRNWMKTLLDSGA